MGQETSRRLFLIDSSPWSTSVQVTLQAGHYFAVVVPIIPNSNSPSGQRALPADGELSGCGDRGVPEKAGRNDEFVVSPERVARRRNFTQQELRDQEPSAPAHLL